MSYFPTNKPSGAATMERTIVEGQHWSVREYICNSGPDDRAFEERHDHFTIAAVIEGVFRYRSVSTSSLLHPGALLLGNHGRCFECHHDHSRGDRCVALHVEPEYFAEVSASASGAANFQFSTAMLPASNSVLPWLAGLEARATTAEPMGIDETVPCLIEAVVGTAAGTKPSIVQTSPRDERRISDVVRHIELNLDAALDLDALASVAVMSKYHFLRTFRRIVGTTPYQFLLGMRMRRVAVRLATSLEPISAVAYDAGFGDLSTFNLRFREVFGMSPTAYRSGNRVA